MTEARTPTPPLTPERQALLTPRILRIADAVAARSARNHAEFDEARSVALEELVVAAANYDPSRGESFSVHAFSRAKYSVMRMRDPYSHHGRWRRLSSLDEPLGTGTTRTLGDLVADRRRDDLAALEDREFAARCLRCLDGTRREAVLLRLDGLSWSDVGERLGCHGDAARKAWGKALREIRRVVAVPEEVHEGVRRRGRTHDAAAAHPDLPRGQARVLAAVLELQRLGVPATARAVAKHAGVKFESSRVDVSLLAKAGRIVRADGGGPGATAVWVASEAKEARG